MTRVLYFSWVRERIGTAGEDLEIPSSVTSVEQMLNWLSSRGEHYEHALSDAACLRVALNQTHVEATAPLNGAREIAIFPPMSGG